MDTSKVTRVEVINHTTRNKHYGRAHLIWAADMTVELSFQDDGRTLKIFLADRKAEDERE